uniref:Zinc transporter ZIP4 n=1 Tax=Timema monikensis TaxID=170555 RepID=A0A7R9E4Z8_9NEOP|nr:unnamed protein product [Timema monikensis]
MLFRLLLVTLVVTHEVFGDLPLNETLGVDHRFFLQQIFSKYGADGIMTFEGFEHLLESLGLGRLKFDQNHNVSLHRVNGTFKDVHDSMKLHKHSHEAMRLKRHTLRTNENIYETALDTLISEHQETQESEIPATPALEKCLSPQDILVTYGLQPNHKAQISPLEFLHICPAIVYELEHHSCIRLPVQQQAAATEVQYMTYVYATISVLIISLLGLTGVLVVPLVNKSYYKYVLDFLSALAVGTLCGDALLHLLPHALMSVDLEDHQSPVLIASVTFTAVTLFFLLDSMMHHSHAKTPVDEHSMTKITTTLEKDNEETFAVMEAGAMIRRSYDSMQCHHHNDDTCCTNSVALMVIIGDGLHNLTDGLAIGAAYRGDVVAGVATSLAVLCHELPHELGDTAVLINTGMPICRVMFYNFVSSVLSFIGLAIGLWLGDYENSSQWIYAFTAGTFIYIALANLIPEMNQNSHKVKHKVLQLGGILTGGAIMLVIALYEDSFLDLFTPSL